MVYIPSRSCSLPPSPSSFSHDQWRNFTTPRVGRRKVFVVLAVKVALLGSLYVFVRQMWVVLVVRCLVSTGLPVLYQIVIISGLEQVADERRGLVTSLSSIFFSVGQCLLAPVAWVTGHWVTLGLLALVYLRVIEESPRWLVCQGRLREASCVLRRMAHMNGFHVSTQHVLTRLRKVCGSGKKQVTMTEASHGPLHMMRLLVRYPRMAARTALVTICWTVNMILYYNTTMKYPYVFVNPFLGWFSISVMEVPANIMVLFLLKKVGRRPLHAGVMAISTASLLSTACVLALGYEERQTTVAVLVLVAKFSASMTFLVIYLQAAELHPTPVRTCATGGASLVAIACNVFSPTIVAMARPWHSYLLLGSLGLLGVLSASLLPETAGRPLPQTLDDAENFARRRSSSSSSSSSVRSSPRREEGPTVFPSSPPPSVEVSQPISSSHLLGTVKETII
ncbi:organic cation transporter protein-like isoform X3 [Panulirus ornatus]|uniref:organic cation transporter protein-like isoform X3 n=1 Tax=Panulirus ornatus TaxID=150431 RepID=UPI003A8694AE